MMQSRDFGNRRKIRRKLFRPQNILGSTAMLMVDDDDDDFLFMLSNIIKYMQCTVL